jgi:hypothetical protein
MQSNAPAHSYRRRLTAVAARTQLETPLFAPLAFTSRESVRLLRRIPDLNSSAKSGSDERLLKPTDAFRHHPNGMSDAKGKLQKGLYSRHEEHSVHVLVQNYNVTTGLGLLFSLFDPEANLYEFLDGISPSPDLGKRHPVPEQFDSRRMIPRIRSRNRGAQRPANGAPRSC